jgi:anti-sigma B factor antagonist
MAVTGEVDMACADDLVAIGTVGAAGSGTDTLAINVGQLDFIDAAGLGALVRIRNVALESDKRVLLQETPERIQRLLHITGLDGAFPTEPSSNSPFQ